MPQDFYEITTPAASEPILFADAQSWCRDLNVADTDIVNILIKAARFELESRMNRVFVKRSFTGKFSGYCYSNSETMPFIEIRRAPLVSISEIRADGVVVSSDDYNLKESSGFSRVVFPSVEALDADEPYPIEVDFISGYEVVPEDIIIALEQAVLFWYENRGDVSTDMKQELPFVTKQIIRQNRIVNTF